MAKPMMKLTDKEKKMGDALMMTRKGKEVMNAQKSMESDKDMQRRKKQAAADKLLGIGMKEGGMTKKATKAGRAMVKKSADTMGRAMVKKAGGGKCYAKGGSVSSRADGVAKKGKTNTKMVKMAMGGLGTGRASMASEPDMQSPRGERVTVRPKAPPVVKSPKPVGPKFGMYMGSKKGGIVGKKKGGYC